MARANMHYVCAMWMGNVVALVRRCGCDTLTRQHGRLDLVLGEQLWLHAGNCVSRHVAAALCHLAHLAQRERAPMDECHKALVSYGKQGASILVR
jgi:hypothetical protein